MAIAVVWLKRDLRLSDHQSLVAAAASGLSVLLLYCFEPILLTDLHYSARHWRFVREFLQDIQQRGKRYFGSIFNPELSQTHCSPLSATGRA